MNAVKLAIQFLKNNIKNYAFYLLVITVTVAIYYNFLALSYNPSIEALSDTYYYAQIAGTLCSNVLFIVVIFFMWHSNRFFFRQREKETGLYMLMGVHTSKIGKVFAIESMVLGCLAFAIGLPIGILFSKLFFMLLAKIMRIEVVLPFAIPLRAIGELVIVFVILFMVMGIYNYCAVRKSKLIDLIQGAKKEQKIPKMKYIRGLIGVFLIAIGYSLAIKGQDWGINLLVCAMVVLWMVCIGTYFLFGSFLSIVFDRLIKHKNLTYKGVRLLSFSNTLFRLQSNYKNLAMTAILCATTLVAFTTSLSVKAYANHNLQIEVPYSLNYLSNDEALQNQVQEVIAQSTHKITAKNQSEFLLLNEEGQLVKPKEMSDEGIYEIINDKQYNRIVTSYSEVKKVLEAMDYKNKEVLLEKLQCQSGEIISVMSPGVMGSTISSIGTNKQIEGKSYTIKAEAKVPFIGNIGPLANTFGIILNDQDYAKVKGDAVPFINNGINFTQQEDCLPLIEELAGIIPGGLDRMNTYVGLYLYKYKLVGSFYFLGLIMSGVFILATFSTLYFKIISDALSDTAQYVMLKKIGMTEGEILKSIYMQIGISFVLPALVGACHAFMATKVFEQVVLGDYTVQYVTALSLFCVVMIVYYIGMSKKYLKMVYK